MNVLTVVGARPQFVKAAVVSRAFAAHNAAIHRPTDGSADAAVTEWIVHTGQHYDHGMSRVFFEEMQIPEPVVDLAVGSGRHGAQTGAMLAAIEQEIEQRQPDVVLIYGDTNSTLAGALAAVKLHVPVAHVEAGLRSFKRTMPEEINRIVADRVADLLFCPSPAAAEQLAREGIETGVHVVGDVMVDAVLHYRKRAVRPAIDSDFALATVHRAENTDDPAKLGAILATFADAPLPVVLPLHPRTAAAMKRHGLAPRGNLRCVEPLSYLEMLGHLDASRFVLTDSGGLQKEAYLCNKRCVTLRDETEWLELVDIGANRLVGADAAAIRGAFDWARTPLTDTPPIYGDGRAGDAIVAVLSRGH